MVAFPGVCCHQRNHQEARQCASVPRVVPGPGPGWLGAVGTAQGGSGTVRGPSPHWGAHATIRGPKALSGISSPVCSWEIRGESVEVRRHIPATLPGFKFHGDSEGDSDNRRARPRADCSGQDEQFSLVFTIGSFMNNFMTFPMGVVFDRFGTTAARLIAISLYTGGTLLVAFSTPETAVLLFPAMSMLSVGGILLILTNMQVGNLFGNYRSIIITLYNGAFDSSSAIFLIVKLLYERGLSLRAMFLFLAACSAWHLLRTLFLMPRTRIPYPLPPDYDYGLRCRGRSRSYRAHKDKQPPGEAGPEETPLEPAVARGGDGPGTPFRACACSWLFAWHVAWLSVMQLRHYLFIGTLNPQLEHLARGDHALVSTYTNAFAFTQLCGVLCAPWNGLILDRHKRGKGPHPEGVLAALADLRSAVLSLVVTVAQCLLFSVFAAVPVLPVQFGTFALQVISRSFLYGGNAAFLAIAFPPQHFGKLYGLAMALSALVALLQYPCVALVQGPLQGDPFYMNVGLIAVVLVAFVSPVVVARECQRRAKELGKAGTPLAAPSSAEIHAETPH